MVRWVVGLLVAIVSANFSLPAAATATPTNPTSYAYTYDAPVADEPEGYRAPGRGPPVTGDINSTHEAVDLRSRGPSARLSGPLAGATHDYDHAALLVQSDIVATTTTWPDRAHTGNISSFGRWQVAANGAIRVRPPVSVPKGQFGTKFGKHASDYGLDVGDSAARASYMARIRNVHRNPDELRMGQYGAYDDAFMFRQGNDLLITRSDGTFVFLYPGAQTSSWFKNAPVFPHWEPTRRGALWVAAVREQRGSFTN